MDVSDWNERYAEAEHLWGREPNRSLVEHTADLPPGHAIDLASGDGRNALWLADRGWAVTAVDFSDTAIDRGRAEAQRRGVDVDWVVADARSWSPAAPADLVVVLYLHLPAGDRRRAMAVAASAVAPGGRLLVVGHDSDNLEHGVGGPPDASVLYRAQDIVADLAGTGLTIAVAQQVQRPVQDKGVAVDCLVLAARA